MFNMIEMDGWMWKRKKFVRKRERDNSRWWRTEMERCVHVNEQQKHTLYTTAPWVGRHWIQNEVKLVRSNRAYVCIFVRHILIFSVFSFLFLTLYIFVRIFFFRFIFAFLHLIRFSVAFVLYTSVCDCICVHCRRAECVRVCCVCCSCS